MSNQKDIIALCEWITGIKIDDLNKPPTTMMEWGIRYPNSPLKQIPISDIITLTYEQLEEKYPHLLKQ